MFILEKTNDPMEYFVISFICNSQVYQEKLSDDEFSNMLSSMTADNGALGNLIAEGNAQATCQFVGALTSLLNNKAEPEPEIITTTAAPTQGPPRNPKEVAEEEARRLALGSLAVKIRILGLRLGYLGLRLGYLG